MLRLQYAAVGAAARLRLTETVAALEASSGRIDGEIGALLERTRARVEAAVHFVDAYRRYRWPVLGPTDMSPGWETQPSWGSLTR